MPPLIKILIRVGAFILVLDASSWVHRTYTERKTHKDEVQHRVEAVRGACIYLQQFPDELLMLIAPNDSTAADVELFCENVERRKHK